MQEKSWIEICEELGLNTDIFDDEKWDSNIRRDKSGCRQNIMIVMQAKRNRDNRSETVSGPCSYANKYTAKV